MCWILPHIQHSKFQLGHICKSTDVLPRTQVYKNWFSDNILNRNMYMIVRKSLSCSPLTLLSTNKVHTYIDYVHTYVFLICKKKKKLKKNHRLKVYAYNNIYTTIIFLTSGYAFYISFLHNEIPVSSSHSDQN